MVEKIIEIKDVVYEYGDGTKALNKISLSFEKGKKYVLVGPNGAGKSTLMQHLNGIKKPNSGFVAIDGDRMGYDIKSLKKVRSKVGIVFQEPDNQLFSPSVVQEVGFGPSNQGLNKDEVIKRVNDTMEMVNITHLKNKPTHFLSYGQKKRVAIASILAMKPDILVLDEPTSGLDFENEIAMIEILNTVNSEGTTIIISTHDLNLAYSWGDYVYILDKGSIKRMGVPEDVFNDNELLDSLCLKKPWMLDMFTFLKQSVDISDAGKPPKTDKQIKQVFQKYLRK